MAAWLGLETAEFIRFSLIALMAITGYFTNWLAVILLLYPRRKTHWGPFFWHGLVCKKAPDIARSIGRVLGPGLAFPADFFRQQELYPPELSRYLTETARETRGEFYRAVQEGRLRKRRYKEPGLLEKVWEREITGLRSALLEALEKSFYLLFDLERATGVGLGARGGRLITEMFQRLGREEFQFVISSGLVIGGLCGWGQAELWLQYGIPWTLPATGVTAGFVTNWVALKLLFYPRRPWLRLGNWKIQGSLIRIQKQWAAEIANLVTGQLMEKRMILQLNFYGSRHPVMEKICRDQARQTLSNIGQTVAILPSETSERLENVLTNELYERLVASLNFFKEELHDYLRQDLQAREKLEERIRQLSPADFEKMIHYGWESDEIRIIRLGGIIGGLVGGLWTWLVLTGTV